MSSPATRLRAPLLWLLFPLMGGIAAAKAWPFGSGHLLPLASFAMLLNLVSLWLAGCDSRLGRWGWRCCLCVAISIGGFVMLHLREPQLHQWENVPPREITLTMQVQQVFAGTPQSRSLSGIGMVVTANDADRALAGRRIYFSALRRISVPPQRSGRYVFHGVIEPLPHETAETGFDDYLANLGIRQKLTRARIVSEVSPPNRLRQFCNRAEERFEKILAQGLQQHPEITSLYLAMLLGKKAGLSPDQQNAFMRSGTFHIFSISGLHVGVIAMALHSALRLMRIPRRSSALISLLLLWFYLEVTGMNAPALRAFLMSALILGGRIFRLPGNSLAALTLAALVTLLIEPLQLFSTGFQMSYSVVGALVVMGVPLTERVLSHWHPFAWLPRPNWKKFHHGITWVGRLALGSCAGGWVAFLASVPSGIGCFQLFSPGSLITNLIVLPLSSLAIVSGFLSLLTGLAGILSLSALFNSAAAMLILAMDWLTRHGTRFPGFYFEATFTQPWLVSVSVIAMISVMLACLAGGWSRRYAGYWPPVVLVMLLLIFGVKFG